MKQTAVEWLAEKMLYIDNEYDMKLITKSEYQAKRRDIINQAKEMEKQQIIDFTDDYVDNCVIPNENMAIPTKMDVPSYFKEKFSQQEQ
jgi:cystathionine beta-lyase family protein involved in aluminum resistance